jgi:FkbM family methyltransferase
VPVRLPPFDSIPIGIEPRWFLDVGANHGHVSTAALRSFPGLRAVCLEPVHATFEALRANLEPYRERVHLFNTALSDKTESVDIHVTSFDGANSLEPQAPSHQALNPHVSEVGTERIECIRLDELAPRLPSRRFDIVKVDVEGHELKVLNGGEKFFRRSVDVVVIEIALMRDQVPTEQDMFKIFDFFDVAGFYFVNLFDLHRSSRDDVMVAQFDCVFRSKGFYAAAGGG